LLPKKLLKYRILWIAAILRKLRLWEPVPEELVDPKFVKDVCYDNSEDGV
jgi:hypothetical protein